MESMRRKTAVVVLGALAGVLAVAPDAPAQTTPRAAPVPAVPAPATPPRLPECRPGTANAAPPSQGLLGALGVLRAPAGPEDALPADVQRLLRARGLAPVDAASARLLRTTPEGGKAWIVPVPDVGLAGFMPCNPRRDPQEGVVVVAQGGAPAGGGAALPDLVRGRGQVSVDACAGPGRDMLGVSGVVPDGVGAAFLTSPDGTAVRADVTDNGYAFVVPHTRGPQQRYVVWTGGDGTPHVQPVPTTLRPRGAMCRRIPTSITRVTPEPFACGTAIVRPAMPVPARPPRTRRRGGAPRPVRPVPAVPISPAPMTVPCLVTPVPVPVPLVTSPPPAPRRP
jgi:hypothetical protein